ncbi:MAG: transposase [Cyclonatronaceae bacterium]
MRFPENTWHHLYHKSINGSPLFKTRSDFRYFLDRYFYYLHISTHTCCYCLPDNHFHFLIKILPLAEQQSRFNTIRSQNNGNTYFQSTHETLKPIPVETLIGHLLNSYTKYVNKKRERTGPVFSGRFKSKHITDETWLTHLVCYIHRNPSHHGLMEDFRLYPNSSYNLILDETPTYLSRNLVLELFGGKENYIEAHKQVRNRLGDNFFE